MFHILGFLFVIIVVILVIGLSIIGTVLRTVFGLGKRRSSSGTYQNGGGSYQSGRGYSFSGDQQQDASSQSNGETTSTEMISIENTRNFSLKMKENTWILKKLKSNQIFAMPVRMYLPLRLFSFI